MYVAKCIMMLMYIHYNNKQVGYKNDNTLNKHSTAHENVYIIIISLFVYDL